MLIADRSNNRLVVVDPQGRITWQFPRPGDLRHGQSFRVPDDAFFTPDGKQIVVTQEDDFIVTVIDVATRRIVYRYGKPGVAGSGPNRLWNPDDAMALPGGWILTADIKNCRLLLIKRPAHRPSRIYGATSQYCYHDPPRHWGSPNGAFPMRNGHLLVTEINGDWVDELTLGGRVVRSWHPPGFSYPSDSNEVRPGLYLSVDYTSPGGLETFDRQGRVRWRYRPRPGDPPLDHPSLRAGAPKRRRPPERRLQRPRDRDRSAHQPDRLAVRTHRPSGSRPRLPPSPDGVDLVPPHSLLTRLRPSLPLPHPR